MIWHQAKSIYIYKRYSYMRRFEFAKAMIRVDIVQIIESIQVMYKTHTIGIVENNIAFLNATV